MAEARSEEDEDNMTRDSREQQVAARRQSNSSAGKRNENEMLITLNALLAVKQVVQCDVSRKVCRQPHTRTSTHLQVVTIFTRADNTCHMVSCTFFALCSNRPYCIEKKKSVEKKLLQAWMISRRNDGAF